MIGNINGPSTANQVTQSSGPLLGTTLSSLTSSSEKDFKIPELLWGVFRVMDAALNDPQKRKQIIEDLLKIEMDTNDETIYAIVNGILPFFNKGAFERAKRALRIFVEGLKDRDFNKLIERELQGKLHPGQVRHYYLSGLKILAAHVKQHFPSLPGGPWGMVFFIESRNISQPEWNAEPSNQFITFRFPNEIEEADLRSELDNRLMLDNKKDKEQIIDLIVRMRNKGTNKISFDLNKTKISVSPLRANFSNFQSLVADLLIESWKLMGENNPQKQIELIDKLLKIEISTEKETFNELIQNIIPPINHPAHIEVKKLLHRIVGALRGTDDERWMEMLFKSSLPPTHIHDVCVAALVLQKRWLLIILESMSITTNEKNIYSKEVKEKIEAYVKNTFSVIETTVSDPQTRIQIIDHFLKINIGIEQEELIHIVADILGLLNNVTTHNAGNEIAKPSIRILSDGLRGIDFDNTFEKLIQGQFVLKSYNTHCCYHRFLLRQKATLLLNKVTATAPLVSVVPAMPVPRNNNPAVPGVRAHKDRNVTAINWSFETLGRVALTIPNGIEDTILEKHLIEKLGTSTTSAKINVINYVIRMYHEGMNRFSFEVDMEKMLNVIPLKEQAPENAFDLPLTNKPLILSANPKPSLPSIVVDLVEDKPKKALANNKN